LLKIDLSKELITMDDTPSNSLMARFPSADRLRRVAQIAQSGILSLWQNAEHTFYRSTEHAEREAVNPSKQFFPTVTFRSASALADLLTYCDEFASRQTRQTLLTEIIPALVAKRVDEIESSLDAPASGGPNAFTLCQFLRCLVCSLNLSTDGAVRHRVPTIKETINSVATSLLTNELVTLLKNHTVVKTHPFFLYHLRHSLTLAGATFSASNDLSLVLNDIDNAARHAIETLIAREGLGISTPGDAVALAFAAGALAQSMSSGAIPYVAKALAIASSAQDQRGYWAFGRVLAPEKDLTGQRLEIPTFEIAAVLAATTFKLLELELGENVGSDTLRILDSIQRAFEFAERSSCEVRIGINSHRGWYSDHAYGQEIVESWTTATVLESVIATQQLSDAVRRKLLLSSFVCAWPRGPAWPTWLRWDTYRTEGEVDHDHPVLGFIDREIVTPLIANGKPARSKTGGSTSILLFGPPGTSKTTIIRGVADALGWPLVTLSPGDFIKQGLELIEAQSRWVFDRLMILSRAVVIFDECDELFRYRAPRKDSEQTRSITAFVTASMLPKMAELHDSGRIVFCICTNNFHSMDHAIKRGGRIDHILGVGPPDSTARRSIVRSALAGAATSTWPMHAIVLEEIVGQTERFTRTELLRLVRSVVHQGPKSSEDETRSCVRAAVERMRDALTITSEDFEQFRRDQKVYSHVLS
jgi:hypothetical protein